MPDWKYEIGRRLAGVKLEPAREAAIVEELAQYLEDYYAEGKTIKHHFTRFYLFSVHKIILTSSIPIAACRARCFTGSYKYSPGSSLPES